MPEVIFGIIAILATAAYVREYAVRKKIEKEATPTPQDKSNFQTIAQLTDKSRLMVNQAEQNANKIVSGAQVFSAKTAQDFGQKLNVFLEEEEKQTQQAQNQVILDIKSQDAKFDRYIRHLTEVMNNNTDASVKNFNTYLESLKQESLKMQTANWEGAKARVNQLFENFETKLADFLLQTEQKMMLSVDLELKSARQLIDTYKVQQMNIIDENIVAMLEKTLSLVLAKNLNLKDQMELVYESLERAKTESFLV